MNPEMLRKRMRQGCAVILPEGVYVTWEEFCEVQQVGRAAADAWEAQQEVAKMAREDAFEVEMSLKRRLEASEEGRALAEALVLSHEGHIAVINQFIDGLGEYANRPAILAAEEEKPREKACPGCGVVGVNVHTLGCRVAAAAGEWVPHVNKEGSREHVTWWDNEGSRCSEPMCEKNRPRGEEKP